MDLSFQLCSRCKKMAAWGRSQLVHVTIESRIFGAVCNDCRKHIEDKVTEMMNEIPIPEALLPYLIKEKKTPECVLCQMLADPSLENERIRPSNHSDGCPMKNFIDG